jgi:hypothetical protein
MSVTVVAVPAIPNSSADSNHSTDTADSSSDTDNSIHRGNTRNNQEIRSLFRPILQRQTRCTGTKASNPATDPIKTSSFQFISFLPCKLNKSEKRKLSGLFRLGNVWICRNANSLADLPV